jgi:hypothetical protein
VGAGAGDDILSLSHLLYFYYKNYFQLSLNILLAELLADANQDFFILISCLFRDQSEESYTAILSEKLTDFESGSGSGSGR